MRKLIILMLILLPVLNMAQNQDIDLEAFAERLFSIQDQDLNYEDIYESLLVFYTNKLKLNQATPEELASLYMLSPLQVSSFFMYRDRYGPLLSINELQAIPNFDTATIKDMQPFVTVSENAPADKSLLSRIIKEENNYLLLRYSRRLEQQIGYTPAVPLDTHFLKNENGQIFDTLLNKPNRYRGSADKIYARFRTSKKGDFSLGFTFEKDPGEKFEFGNHQYGFDFLSYHLLLENKLGLNKVLLGDFQLQLGQGLVYGAGFSPGKGAEVINTISRSSIGLRPYTSVLESGFFRGIAINKAMGSTDFTVFISSAGRDANLLNDTTLSDSNEFINSIQNTGLHRTRTELERKNSIRETSYGGIINFRPNRRLLIGTSSLVTNYSTPIRPRPRNYNQFEFSGAGNYILSSYFSYSWQNFQLFGEAGRSKSGGIGALVGVMASLSPFIDVAMLFRNYDKNFHSLYGNAFSENNRNINEKGTYWGLSIRPNRRHFIKGYYDFFRFPWLKFGTESPSDGYEWLIRYTFRANRQISLYAQAREQLKQVTLPAENLNILTDQKRRNYLFSLKYKATNRLTLRTKVQSGNQKEGEVFSEGFALIQDINFAVWKFQFHTRMALFETENFDNAQYVYENDVLYTFTIPAYSGVGIRNYAMMRYDPHPDLSIWIRYAQTAFSDRESVGAGLDESQESVASEIKLMLRKKF